MNGKIQKVMRLYESKKLIYFLILFCLFPPVPRLFFSVIFKIEFLSLIFLSFFMLKKIIEHKEKLEFSDFKIFIAWIVLIVLGAIVGLFNHNSTYNIIKDIIYMLIPLWVFLLLYVFIDFIDKNFFKVLFKYGVIISVLQIVLTIYALLHGISREVFRHTLLLFTLEVIPLLLVLKIIFSRKLLDWYVVVYLLALLSTEGRGNFLFVFLFVVTYFFLQRFKTKKYRFFYLILMILGFTFIWISPLVIPQLQTFFGSSLKWRYMEWNSFFDFAQHSSFDFLTGKGLGALLPSLKPLTLFDGVKLHSLGKFHNIFIFLFFKFGFLGMFFYVFLGFFIFKKIAFLDNNKDFWLTFFLSFILFVLFVFNGGFTHSVSQGVILGFVLFLMENRLDIFKKNDILN